MNRRQFLKAMGIGAAGLALGGTYYVNRPEFGRLPTGMRRERILASPHYYDGQFQNLEPIDQTVKGGEAKAMAEFLFGSSEGLKPKGRMISQKTDLHSLPLDEDCVVWMGHSSLYLHLGGYRILVDPVFSSYASPAFFINRAFDGSNIYAAADIPPVDVLVLSHDHWDHLDYPSVMALKDKAKHIICPLGVGEYFEQWGFDMARVYEEDWYTAIPLAGDLTVHVLPSQHFSGRLLKRNQTQWAGFAFVTPGRRVYVSGDGGYGSHFRRIGEVLGPFDLAVMENGQYNERWACIHLMPEEAAQAAVDVGAKAVLSVHNGKFALSRHPWAEPYQRLSAASIGKPYKLLTPKIGEAVPIGDDRQTFSAWWEQME